MLATITKRVNARLEANTSSKKLVPLELGTKINIVELKFGEDYRGNSIWYIDEKGISYTSLAITPNLNSNRLSSFIDFPSIWNICKNKVIKIGIYDSGVSKDTSLFGNRVTQLNDHKLDAEKHADYMATIIAGGSVEKGYFGFLPNAEIYSYQADVDDNGHTTIKPKNFMEALQAFLDYNVDVVNISMATIDFKEFFEQNLEFKKILKEFAERNIPLVSSAGNECDTDNSNFHYPAKLSEFLSISGYLINGTSINFDFMLNLWDGINLLSPSFQVYPTEFYQQLKIDINKRAGSSVSCAITCGVLGILKYYFNSSDFVNQTTFGNFMNSIISSMPDWKTNPLYNKISSTSFKYLDFTFINKKLKF